METLDAYRDHGNPAQRLQEGVEKAERVLKQLDEIGISLLDATHQLEDEGVEKFNKPYDKTMEKLRSKVQ
jgi:transaldolase